MRAESESWGRNPKASQEVSAPFWLMEDFSRIRTGGKKVLPFGQGRSYGDCCLNDGGILINTGFWDRFICFNEQEGILRCEAGCTLRTILDFAVPRGWFLPVTPGTKHVSVGGAIANDVHGKNHHRAGTFGRYVKRFLLLRSDGSKLLCSPENNADLYKATIGGLGLTGIILWVDLELKKIETPYILFRGIQFRGLDEFFALSKACDRDFEYTVAWLDCASSGKNFARGILMAGNHARMDDLPEKTRSKFKSGAFRMRSEICTVPFDAPSFLLNSFTIKAFNELYFHKQFSKEVNSLVRFEPFFYPLDIVHNWNRLYGKRGLFQFQCSLAPETQGQVVREMLLKVVEEGAASFLSVIKQFGSIASPGLLSFPRQGLTLNLDVPNNGERTIATLKKLEKMTVDGGGALYPAKDATMEAQSFARFYPALDQFLPLRDPAFSSSFSRRVGI